MSQNDAEASVTTWQFGPEGIIQRVEVAARAPLSVVADDSPHIYVLGQDGQVQGKFRVGAQVRRLRANDDGSMFTALAGGRVIYAFDQTGKLEWRVEFQTEVIDYAQDPGPAHIVAVGPEGKVYMHDIQSRRTFIAETNRPVQSVELLEAAPLRIGIASGEGRLSVARIDGEIAWDTDIKSRTGPICFASRAGLVAVPALDKGLILFGLRGERKGSIDLGRPVMRAAATQDGSGFVIEAESGTLLMVDLESKVDWEWKPGPKLSDWALGGGGRVIAATQGSLELCVRDVAPPSHARAEAPAVALHCSIPVTAGAAPSDVKSGHVRWSGKLPQDVASAGVALLAVTRGGESGILVSSSGSMLIMDGRGAVIHRHELPMPTHMAPVAPADALALWSEKGALLIGPGEVESRRIVFDVPVRYLDCANELDVICTAGIDDVVRVFDGQGELLWSREYEHPPVGVFCSPDGRTIMAHDQSGRFRSYDRSGRLLKKFRFADEEDYRSWGLGSGFAVLSTPSGMVMVRSTVGGKLWKGRPLKAIANIEVFEDYAVVYPVDRGCAMLVPSENKCVRLEPPPGLLCLRRGRGRGPILVHQQDSVLTAYMGRGQALELLWRVECGDRISQFTVDRDGAVVAAVAGSKIFLIDCAEQP
ncbi:MAG: hypothetical protein J7M08_03640 [Planctomycetes bacterium]|nr:hypothetical protein [Planctomycetota bacterium]